VLLLYIYIYNHCHSLLQRAMSNNSLDTLSASQQQLLTSVQQLQDAQKDLMNRYSGATDPNERKNIADEMDKNEMLRSNLLSSSGAAALVQSHAISTKQDAAADLTAMTLLMEAELKSARDQLEEIQTSRLGKERMIQLNTYYGKRFMAQAGVMKIFIYMCIPILILAVLANMGFLPNYIAGFAIIASIVIGIVYIYGAVHDINRRDKMNFDEYTWEFDPSRVGPIVHPHHHHKKKDSAGAVAGCTNEACCESKNQWNPSTNKCDVQGDNSHVKGTSQKVGKTGAMSIANTAAPATGLLGDLSKPTAITTPPPPTTPPPTTPPPTTPPDQTATILNKKWNGPLPTSGAVKSITQFNDGTIVGVGMDNYLYTKTSLNANWSGPVSNTCCVIGITQMNDGTILGIGTDNQLYLKQNLNDSWSDVIPNTCCVKSIIQLKDGTIVGVGMDNYLYTKSSVNANWSGQVPGSCCITSVAQLNDGTIMGVGTDNQLYTRTHITEDWSNVIPNSCCIIGITQLKDGTIVGIGTANDLWTKS
jgi:hypothetical protein